MRKSAHILLIGANFINKGAEAMLKTVQQEISKHYDNAVFYMICRDYEKKLAEECGFVPIYDEFSDFKKQVNSLIYRAEGKFMKVFLKKNKSFVVHFPYQTIKKKIQKLDLVVDISGFAYADSFGEPLMAETIKLIDFCKRNYNSKFYFFPQAWGSFNKPEVAISAKEMLSKADLFYARDLISQEFLSSLLKRNKQKVPLLHDIVFAYEGSKSIKPQVLLKSIGYSKSERPLIGISPNMRVYEKEKGQGEDNSYLQILMNVSTYCIQELNADILLIPNEIFPDEAEMLSKVKDDRFLCRMLHEKIKAPGRCFIVDGYRSSEEIKAFISQLDLLVSSRFHALIFGFLHAVPVMAISWSHKYKELFGLFRLDDFVLESNSTHSGSVISLLRKLYEEKEEVSKKISLNLGKLKSDVTEMFSEVSLPNSLPSASTKEQV